MPTSTTSKGAADKKQRRLYPNFQLHIDDDLGVCIVTTDMNLAAYLKVMQYEIVSIRPKDGNAAIGEFWVRSVEENAEVEAKKCMDFYNNRGIAGRYLDFANAYNDLKKVVHQYK